MENKKAKEKKRAKNKTIEEGRRAADRANNKKHVKKGSSDERNASGSGAGAGGAKSDRSRKKSNTRSKRS